MQMAAGRNCQMCMGNAPSASPQRAASRRRSVALPVLRLERAQAWKWAIAKQSAVLITWFKNGACPANQLTNLLARARSSSASDKSKSAHRPKHCTKPPIFDGMENPMA